MAQFSGSGPLKQQLLEMNVQKVLVTGAAGYLGAGLCEWLESSGFSYVGLDVISKEEVHSPLIPRCEPIYKMKGEHKFTRCGNKVYTTAVGSIVDKATVESIISQDIDVILHTAALHKPNVSSHDAQDFIDTNITGTLNLLESAVAHKVKAFIFTSTTSLFGSANHSKPGEPAARVTEDATPVPLNVYGVTKYSAEQLCRLYHVLHSLPIIILRTSRFFPEPDDLSKFPITDENFKANEYLYRRVHYEDVINSHLHAIIMAPRLGYDLFIISAVPPNFTSEDLVDLGKNAPLVIARYYPRYKEIYEKLGWKMFPTFDRVYFSNKCVEVLRFTPKYNFEIYLEEMLQKLTK